jgi:hypothetical protein
LISDEVVDSVVVTAASEAGASVLASETSLLVVVIELVEDALTEEAVGAEDLDGKSAAVANAVGTIFSTLGLAVSIDLFTRVLGEAIGAGANSAEATFPIAPASDALSRVFAPPFAADAVPRPNPSEGPPFAGRLPAATLLEFSDEGDSVECLWAE